MTPEERFDKIEDVLQRTAEQQAQHEREIDKQNEAIRSLIVVARTCLDSIKDMRESHDADYKKLRESHDADFKKLVEAQAATDEKLNILVNTVDRIIRRESRE
jgi:hypothetical protein